VLVGLRYDAVIMASHAIFPRDGGMEAPASVVGLQFEHSALLSRFISITSKTTVSKSVHIHPVF
jgi:voltage-dependent calcium channel alpha-2/delta-4